MNPVSLNPSVDAFITRAPCWQAEMSMLREIVIGVGLTEDMKWGKPCYALDGSNVVIIIPFKEYCALLFFKGGLMKDPKGLLVQAGENSQAGRQLRFTSVAEVKKTQTTISSYLKEAIALQQSGVKMEKTVVELPRPAELEARFKKNPALKRAFEALTPGRRRAYLMHFNSAKQTATREARIDKNSPMILQGIGLNER